MSEPRNKDGCFISALSIIVAILVIYIVIDMYADTRDMGHIRDLQRRVGELEQRK